MGINMQWVPVSHGDAGLFQIWVFPREGDERPQTGLSRQDRV